jgi:hypothetical protein
MSDYAERYNTPTPPRPLQDVIADWLDAANDESQSAKALVAAGYELASKVHAEAAAQCIARAMSLYDHVAPGHVERTVQQFAEYKSEAEQRYRHSVTLLSKAA